MDHTGPLFLMAEGFYCFDILCVLIIVSGYGQQVRYRAAHKEKGALGAGSFRRLPSWADTGPR